ncbi:C6 domain protein [Dictyocaulus viviparus]|uniref:C6 domain protein n=1 Tax=Dictyocaulus viviparus TaxID=29172 RepID=A0A0D8Y9N9_DICVI|nr:C6 domain protein [Dictyocaulus viviparus]
MLLLTRNECVRLMITLLLQLFPLVSSEACNSVGVWAPWSEWTVCPYNANSVLNFRTRLRNCYPQPENCDLTSAYGCQGTYSEMTYCEARVVTTLLPTASNILMTTSMRTIVTPSMNSSSNVSLTSPNIVISPAAQATTPLTGSPTFITITGPGPLTSTSGILAASTVTDLVAASNSTKSTVTDTSTMRSINSTVSTNGTSVMSANNSTNMTATATLIMGSNSTNMTATTGGTAVMSNNSTNMTTTGASIIMGSNSTNMTATTGRTAVMSNNSTNMTTTAASTMKSNNSTVMATTLQPTIMTNNSTNTTSAVISSNSTKLPASETTVAQKSCDNCTELKVDLFDDTLYEDGASLLKRYSVNGCQFAVFFCRSFEMNDNRTVKTVFNGNLSITDKIPNVEMVCRNGHWYEEERGLVVKSISCIYETPISDYPCMQCDQDIYIPPTVGQEGSTYTEFGEDGCLYVEVFCQPTKGNRYVNLLVDGKSMGITGKSINRTFTCMDNATWMDIMSMNVVGNVSCVMTNGL